MLNRKTFHDIWMVALEVDLIIPRAEKFLPVLFNMRIGGTVKSMCEQQIGVSRQCNVLYKLRGMVRCIVPLRVMGVLCTAEGYR